MGDLLNELKNSDSNIKDKHGSEKKRAYRSVKRAVGKKKEYTTLPIAVTLEQKDVIYERCHARGISVSERVKELLKEDGLLD